MNADEVKEEFQAAVGYYLQILVDLAWDYPEIIGRTHALQGFLNQPADDDFDLGFQQPNVNQAGLEMPGGFDVDAVKEVLVTTANNVKNLPDVDLQEYKNLIAEKYEEIVGQPLPDAGAEDAQGGGRRRSTRRRRRSKKTRRSRKTTRRHRRN